MQLLPCMERLNECLVDVKACRPAASDWTRPRHKSCGSSQHNSWLRLTPMRCDSRLASRVQVLDAARNLGVLFYSQLSMSAEVSTMCRTGYYQLLQLRPLLRCLSEDAAKSLIQTFINTRLDYCNSLYYGIADGLMSRLQSVPAERRGTSHDWSQAVRAHHASATSVALTTSPPTSGIQAIHPRLPFVGRYCSCVPSWWVYAGHCRWPPSIAVCC